MINNVNNDKEQNYTTTDASCVVDEMDRMCIHNDLVGGSVFTNSTSFHSFLDELRCAPESEYATWGGKQGFLTYLKIHLKKDDKYFRKNRGMVTLENPRYQEFCDDMVLYVAFKHVVNNEPISVIPITKFEQLDASLKLFHHKPSSVNTLN